MRAWSEPDAARFARGASLVRTEVRLIFSPCLNDLPEKHTMSELFAGFYRHA